MMNYQIINIIDERDRLVRVNYYISNKSSQQTSHTISYLGAREQYKKRGYIMGLDKEIRPNRY